MGLIVMVSSISLAHWLVLLVASSPTIEASSSCGDGYENIYQNSSVSTIDPADAVRPIFETFLFEVNNSEVLGTSLFYATATADLNVSDRIESLHLSAQIDDQQKTLLLYVFANASIISISNNDVSFGPSDHNATKEYYAVDLSEIRDTAADALQTLCRSFSETLTIHADKHTESMSTSCYKMVPDTYYISLNTLLDSQTCHSSVCLAGGCSNNEKFALMENYRVDEIPVAKWMEWYDVFAARTGNFGLDRDYFLSQIVFYQIVLRNPDNRADLLRFDSLNEQDQIVLLNGGLYMGMYNRVIRSDETMSDYKDVDGDIKVPRQYSNSINTPTNDVCQQRTNPCLQWTEGDPMTQGFIQSRGCTLDDVKKIYESIPMWLWPHSMQNEFRSVTAGWPGGVCNESTGFFIAEAQAPDYLHVNDTFESMTWFYFDYMEDYSVDVRFAYENAEFNTTRTRVDPWEQITLDDYTGEQGNCFCTYLNAIESGNYTHLSYASGNPFAAFPADALSNITSDVPYRYQFIDGLERYNEGIEDTNWAKFAALLCAIIKPLVQVEVWHFEGQHDSPVSTEVGRICFHNASAEAPSTNSTVDGGANHTDANNATTGNHTDAANATTGNATTGDPVDIIVTTVETATEDYRSYALDDVLRANMTLTIGTTYRFIMSYDEYIQNPIALRHPDGGGEYQFHFKMHNSDGFLNVGHLVLTPTSNTPSPLEYYNFYENIENIRGGRLTFVTEAAPPNPTEEPQSLKTVEVKHEPFSTRMLLFVLGGVGGWLVLVWCIGGSGRVIRKNKLYDMYENPEKYNNDLFRKDSTSLVF